MQPIPRRSPVLTLLLSLVLAVGSTLSPANAQPTLDETAFPLPILDPDHFIAANGNFHTPTAVIGPNRPLGKDVVYLFFHGGLWGEPPKEMNPHQNVCADGDDISVAIIDLEDIRTPGTDTDLYTSWLRLRRVSPCSSDTHAYSHDSMGLKLAGPGDSWTHGHPFTDGGFLTDHEGQADKFMIMGRGSNFGTLSDTFLFRTKTWNTRDAEWNAGAFPLVTIHPDYINDIKHVTPMILPPTPTSTAVDTQGHQIVTWHGYFRWNGRWMGRVIVKYSPTKWGSARPTRVWIQDQNGDFQGLGSSGVLDFLPKQVHKELTNRVGVPMQIYQEGSQLYLITREQYAHNGNFPLIYSSADPEQPPSHMCKPQYPSYHNIHLQQRGQVGYTLRIFPFTGNHLAGSPGEGTPGTLTSTHRTVTGQLPTDYQVSMFGGGMLKIGSTTYFISADRLDSVCSRLMCENFDHDNDPTTPDQPANPFCGLQISTSVVDFN